MKKICFFILLAGVVCLAACAEKSEKKDDYTEVIQPVEAYYDAIVSQKRERIGSIACAEWEKDALRDVDAFMGVKAELKDFSCEVENMDAESALVICQGHIDASYGAEVTEFSLQNRQHRVVLEQGEWRICGY